MPIIPQTYTCDHCGANSGPEPYLWYVILHPSIFANSKIPAMEIRHLHPGTTYAESTEYICGQSCLLCRVAELATSNLDPDSPNPQMETFILPTASPSPAALVVLESYARRYSGYNSPKEGAAPTNRKET